MTELPGEIAILVQQVTGESGIGPQTRLDGDLLLDSIELAALSRLLQERYGEEADLLRHVASLDIDEIINLSVAGVARFVEEREQR
ncbi:hypothetical protein [Catelliglobosispora koreensis]|uniref:hypothetical protein n=1 Tax=Catelliglobosispora koreensis TaxID=129052 RepID=UPI0003683195|nr:hypothetical protein [Catelliglobosispora koreensis]